jgi:hypothetical protein
MIFLHDQDQEAKRPDDAVGNQLRHCNRQLSAILTIEPQSWVLYPHRMTYGICAWQDDGLKPANLASWLF